MAERAINVEGEEERKEQVVLLHGIARSARSMSKMATALERHGFAVLNLNYPSTSRSLAGLAQYVRERMRDAGSDGFEKLHFVTHSMGGVLVRVLLGQARPSNLGQVVMLAPPNHGSEVADFLAPFPPYKWIYGPAGLELQTGQKGITEGLAEFDYPVGIIAGKKTLDPISSWIIGGGNDGKVSVASTMARGMTAHKVMPVNHTFLMRDRSVIENTICFLKQGHFNEASNET